VQALQPSVLLPAAGLPNQERRLALYELRTYTVTVGKMADVVALYQEQGWPALARHPDRLVGYFTGDVGAMNQLVHLWKFDDDADRRAFWAGVFGDAEFMAFAARLRPLLQSQENKLLSAAPWGPHP
jgi:NIPSNAP